jgi:hypothetical protein
MQGKHWSQIVDQGKRRKQTGCGPLRGAQTPGSWRASLGGGERPLTPAASRCRILSTSARPNPSCSHTVHVFTSFSRTLMPRCGMRFFRVDGRSPMPFFSSSSSPSPLPTSGIGLRNRIKWSAAWKRCAAKGVKFNSAYIYVARALCGTAKWTDVVSTLLCGAP